jgi:hypothetical protein
MPSSDLKSKPNWLDYYATDSKVADTNFGFDPAGMWFSGDSEGAAYPIRTNYDTASNESLQVTWTFNQSDCSDQSVCFFKADQTPNWSWGDDSSRIAISVNCDDLYIYGQSNEVFCLSLSEGSPYTIEATYTPTEETVVVKAYEGTTKDNLLGTYTLNERLPDGAYRVGFDADQDNFPTRSYFTYLQVGRETIREQQYPMPIYRFRVNVIDWTQILPNVQPNDLDNIIRSLEQTTVFIPYVDRPLKHGDEFTLYGSRAIRVYELYIDKKPQVLELV